MNLFILGALLLAFNTVYAVELTCHNLNTNAHELAQTVKVDEAEKILSFKWSQETRYGAYLIDRDAVQTDASIIEDGVATVYMSNGCDNSYDLSFVVQELEALLSSQVEKIFVRIEYAFYAEEKEPIILKDDFKCSVSGAKS